MLEASGLNAHFRAEKDGQDRLENLEELVNAADAFVREAEIATDAPMLSDRVAPDTPSPDDGPQEGATDPLTAFLAHAALEAGDMQAAEGRPVVIVRGLGAPPRDGNAAELVRPKRMDLFR